MARTAYYNNDVEITIEPIDPYEANVNVNGKNLICISRETEDEFTTKLSQLLDEYKI